MNQIEPVTIFVALSGRHWSWGDLIDFLETKPDAMPLVLCDTSQDHSFHRMVRQATDHMHNVTLYQQSVGPKGLADRERKSPAEKNAVQEAVVRIYSRVTQQVTTPFTLFIEDDVIPQTNVTDLTHSLFEGMTDEHASVSALYRHRVLNQYTAWEGCSASQFRPIDDRWLKGKSGFVDVGGYGFGCLLLRTHLLKDHPLSVPDEGWFDPQFFAQLREANWKLALATHITSDHLARDEHD